MNRTASSYNRNVSNLNKNWKVASYIRLSKEDEKNRGVRESESVSNQRNLLMSYIEDNGLALAKEYIDDGVSGTTFDRPQFNAMIDDIEHGRINMVITKDMSRLGRDYIQAGHYMEQYFPSKNVRYISLLDNIDTYLDSSSNDIAPFKAILNDMYSKDMSKKIRSVLHSKKEQGLFLGKVAPYGYHKSAEDKHRLVIDPVAANVVAEVFELYLNGNGCHQIASLLSKRKIPIPSVHNKIVVGNAGMAYGLWSHTGVRRILQNEVYTGTLVQNKYKKLNYKSKKTLETDPDTWMRTPNAHEAIISQEVFDKAQRLLEVTAHLKPSKHRYLLSGLLRCHDCGSYISLTLKDKKYGQIYGRCGRYIQYHRFGLCTTHSFNYTKLEKHVLDLLKDLCLRYLDSERMAVLFADARNNRRNEEAKAKLLETEIAKIRGRIDILYEDRLNGVISADDFKRMSAKANAEIEQMQSQLDALKAEPQSAMGKKEQEAIINEFLSMATPSQALMTQLIDRIEVKEGHEFDVYFAFPEFQTLHGGVRDGNDFGNEHIAEAVDAVS